MSSTMQIGDSERMGKFSMKSFHLDFFDQQFDFSLTDGLDLRKATNQNVKKVEGFDTTDLSGLEISNKSKIELTFSSSRLPIFAL